MLAPIFTHGTFANTIKAIAEGKIQYPGYCWITDTSQYGFINKNNKLEIIGMPSLTGTPDQIIVLSSLIDGLYQIRGQHKITADHPVTFNNTSYVLVEIETINEKKVIRRITSDDLTTYMINEDLSVTENEVVTEQYLIDNDYITEDYVDDKIADLKLEIEDEIEELVTPVIRPIVEEIIDEEIESIDEEDIIALFS